MSLGLDQHIHFFGVGAKFGRWLETARDQAGLNQEQLAEAVGVLQQTVSKWEVGKSVPKAPMLRLIASAVRVPDNEALAARLADEEFERSQDRTAARAAAADRDYVIKTTKQFLDQYEDLGHTYRRLDEETASTRERLERIEADIAALRALRSEVAELVAWISSANAKIDDIVAQQLAVLSAIKSLADQVKS